VAVGEEVHVTWTALDNATEYNVHRAEGGGEAEVVATVTDTVFEDTDVVAGTTYTYSVTAMVDGNETEACEGAEVTAIPVFPTLIAGALAGIAGIGSYALLRRRG